MFHRTGTEDTSFIYISAIAMIVLSSILFLVSLVVNAQYRIIYILTSVIMIMISIFGYLVSHGAYQLNQRHFMVDRTFQR